MKIGFTSVVGDLFHAGHAAMIQECKMHCDYLIVGVMAGTQDREGKETPTQSLFERMWQVRCTKGVDEVIGCGSEKDLELAIRTIHPDIRFVGADYIGRGFTGKEYCVENGIDIYYNRRDHGLSSSELKRRIRRAGE